MQPVDVGVRRSGGWRRWGGALAAAALLAVVRAGEAGGAVTIPPATLQIQLRVETGAIRVEPAGSRLEASPAFRAALRRPPGEIERELLEHLDTALRALGDVYVVNQYNGSPPPGWDGPPEERARVAALRAVSGPWAAAAAAIQVWADRLEFSPNYLGTAYGKLFGDDSLLAPALAEGPLRLVPADDPGAIFVAGEAGQVILNVTPPFTAAEWSGPFLSVGTNPGALAGAPDLLPGIRARLRSQAGELWWNQRIRREAEDYLAARGFGIAAETTSPSVRLDLDAGSHRAILAGPPVLQRALLTFAPGQGGADPTDAAVYSLLSSVAFARYRAARGSYLVRTADGERQLFSVPAEEPPVYLSTELLQEARGRLAAIGLDLTAPLATEDREGRDLQVTRVAPAGANPAAKGPRGPPRNHLKVEARFLPDRTPRVSLGYDRLRLAGDDALNLRAGAEDKPLGGFSYSRDYLGFAALGRRLSVTVAAGDDRATDRALAGASATEQRSTATLAGALELWRDRAGQWLSIDAQIGVLRSVLETETGRQERVRGLTAAFNANYRHGRRGGAVPATDVEYSAGFGAPDGESRDYAWTRLLVTRRDFLAGFIQYEVRARAAAASSGVPAAERPSLGGEDSLRGFRRDAAAADFVWSVQNEIWLPLRIAAGPLAKWGTFIRRNVHFAVFADCGGFPGDGRPVRAGGGAGLRVRHGMLTVRLDGARAVNADAAVRGGTSFYLTFSTTPQF